MANKNKKVKTELTEDIINNTEINDVEEVVAEPVAFGFVNNCLSLNVRSGKNTKSAVIEVIKCNEKVEITDTFDDWYGVITANGTKGFCMKQYIKV